MPTYEYECEGCGGLFEVFHSMSEPHKEKCDECGGKLVKLLSGGAGLIFKGSGFYITDYKGGGKEEKKSESGAEAKSDSAGEKKSDSGGEKKSESAEKKSDSGAATKLAPDSKKSGFEKKAD